MTTRLTKSELFPAKRAVGFENRVKGTIKFINLVDMEGRVADCGEANPLKHHIENHFKIEIDSLDWDFNKAISSGKKYDTILCFEVLEHLYNPLLFLECMKASLKSNGCIYLSIPRVWPQCMRSTHHFHEIPTDRLMWLFNEAGLSVICEGKVTLSANWYHHIIGIRPNIRYFWKTRIYKLV